MKVQHMGTTIKAMQRVVVLPQVMMKVMETSPVLTIAVGATQMSIHLLSNYPLQVREIVMQAATG